MSLAVKILLILNLVLAMVVAVVTMVEYATTENWKRRWDSDSRQLFEQLKDSRDRVMELSFDKSLAQSQVTAANVRIGELTLKVKELDTNISEKSGEISRLSQEISQKSTEIASLREINQSLTASLELSRQNASEKTHIAQVARAAAFQLNVKLAEVEDDLNNTRAALTQRDEELNKTKKEFDQDKAKLAILKVRHPKIWAEIADEHQSPAFIQGIVAAVQADPTGKQDLVVLTVGKNDKVEEGTEFIVYRNNKYIVKVRVEKVLTDMVSCRVIPESWNKEGIEIKQGDTAQNRL